MPPTKRLLGVAVDLFMAVEAHSEQILGSVLTALRSAEHVMGMMSNALTARPSCFTTSVAPGKDRLASLRQIFVLFGSLVLERGRAV